MAIHSKNEALICKVFPSSLGPVAMRWFNGLRANSIDSFKKLTRAFGARFITCSRVPRPLGSLLSMSMREGETLKSYSNRYWEMFNEIGGEYDDVAISTFKAGLRISNWYRRVEEDQLLGKGKAKVIPQERRDFKLDQYNNNRPQKDIVG
ncbi:uncharacterized protein LOC126698410 [Quercus robur]|uniref:uncharacterized protein LOC126698410 n=1 Tax=Quercus robur TaxID=38942 RepID=UPI002161DB89|nr:uncharacterized protein LOC126698410 [Quercus robur]